VRLLVDSCVWGNVADVLRAEGHDVVWVGDWPSDPGDEEILVHAQAEKRTVITLDKDFGELAIHHGLPHHGILRIVNFSAKRQADVCVAVLDKQGGELTLGAIATAEPGRLRIRPAQ